MHLKHALSPAIVRECRESVGISISSVSSGRWPDDSLRKQNTRDVLTISNVLFMQRGRSAEFRLWKKKNILDLPGRLESCRYYCDDFSFL